METDFQPVENSKRFQKPTSGLRRWFKNLFSKETNRKLNEEEKLQKARQRWIKIRSLRHVILTRLVTKKETDQQFEEAIKGQKASDQKNFKNLLHERKKYICYPGNNLKKCWDILRNALIVYFCIAAPYRQYFKYRLGFDSEQFNGKGYEHLIWYEFAFDILLFIDIILIFFTAYQKDSINPEDKFSKIAGNYIRGLFIFDVIAVIPFYLIKPYLMFFKLLRLLRLNACFRINPTPQFSEFLEKINLRWNTQLYIVRVVKFLVFLYITCHLIACIWNFVNVWPDGKYRDDAWINNYPYLLNEAPSDEIYLACLYYIITTFTTVGYGDITPHGDAQMVYAIMVEFYGVMVFAYLMGSINSILSDFYARDQERQRKSDELDKWLHDLDHNYSEARIEPQLYNDIQDHFKYLWDRDHTFIKDETDFLMQMPYKLRAELVNYLFEDFFITYSIFFDDMPEGFKHDVVLSLYPRKYDKDEEIIRQGEVVTEFYFITQGSVLIGTKGGFQTFLKLEKGTYFGENYILCEDIPKAKWSFVAGEEGCDIMYMERGKFEETCNDWEEAAQKLRERAIMRNLYFDNIVERMMQKRVEDVKQDQQDNIQQEKDKKVRELGKQDKITDPNKELEAIAEALKLLVQGESSEKVERVLENLLVNS